MPKSYSRSDRLKKLIAKINEFTEEINIGKELETPIGEAKTITLQFTEEQIDTLISAILQLKYTELRKRKSGLYLDRLNSILKVLGPQ